MIRLTDGCGSFLLCGFLFPPCSMCSLTATALLATGLRKSSLCCSTWRPCLRVPPRLGRVRSAFKPQAPCWEPCKCASASPIPPLKCRARLWLCAHQPNGTALTLLPRPMPRAFRKTCGAAGEAATLPRRTLTLQGPWLVALANPPLTLKPPPPP